MSRILEFTYQDHIITLTYSKKSFPSKFYSQTFVNIQVTTTDNEYPILDIDIDDNFTFMYFDNLSEFFKHLSKHKNEDIVRLTNGDEVSFQIDGEREEYEVIQLNAVQVVTEQEHEEMSKRVNFYNDAFKTKMISKFEKIIKNHYKNPREQKRQEAKAEQKKQMSLTSGSQISFSINSKKYNQVYTLNENQPFFIFDVDLEEIFEKDFKIRVQSLKYDKILVGVEYHLSNPEIETAHHQNQFRRICQFNKAYGSSLQIEQGQSITVSIDEGQLVIRNAETNNGKMFAESISNNELDWKYRVIVSLVDL